VTPAILPLSPPHDEVHIWHLRFSAMTSFAPRMETLLDPQERLRSQRIRDHQRRNQFILTRAALRTILEAYDVAPASAIQLNYSATGKPALSDSHHNSLLFNVSYRGDQALLAFTDVGPIGVDIEAVCPFPLAEQILADSCATEEIVAYRALAYHEKLTGFYTAWTRKEAYLKACGEGLRRPLNSFAVSLAPADPPRLLRVDGSDDEHRKWLLADVPVPPGYCAAFALRTSASVPIRFLTFDPLSNSHGRQPGN
jgi:4'-phosphopantetheinyl transferase